MAESNIQKTQASALIPGVDIVPNPITKEKEKLVFQQIIQIPSLHVDTSSSAEEPIPVLRITDSREESSKEVPLEEESSSSVLEQFSINQKQVQKNIEEFQKNWEIRHSDSIASAVAAPVIATSSPIVPAKVTPKTSSKSLSTESASSTWNPSNLVRTALDYFNNWTGWFSKPVETTLESVEAVDKALSIAPLGSRPVLSEPVFIENKQYRKFIHELISMEARLQEAFAGDVKIILIEKADVQVMQMIQDVFVKQGKLTQESIQLLTLRLNENAEKNRKKGDEIAEIGGKLHKQLETSYVFGLINTGTTFVVLVSSAFFVALAVSTSMGAGTPLAAAALTGLAELNTFAGLFEGSGILAKGVIDHLAAKNKAQIQFIATDRQILNGQTNDILNSLRRLIASLHESDKGLAEAARLYSDTLKAMQS